MLKVLFIAAVTSLSMAAQANSPASERVWGSNENTALADADWQQVVNACQYWVNNKENSQINPHAQNISCVLNTNGMEQVGVVEVPRTYVTNSTLTAGASNGKGNQRSEQSQQRPRVEEMTVTCPVIQNVQRQYRFDFSLSCEEVAKAQYRSKIQLCENKWLSQFNGINNKNELKEALNPYSVSERFTGDKLTNCSTK